MGCIAGCFFVFSMEKKKKDEDIWELYIVIPIALFFIGPTLHITLSYFLNSTINYTPLIKYSAIWVLSFLIGIYFLILYLRHIQPKISVLKTKKSKKTSLERDLKSDVRTVRNHMPKTKEPFNIMNYYEKGYITVGIDKDDKPIKITSNLWKSSHIQLSGTTGAGKGVSAQMLLCQAIYEDESIIVLDPKNDEWAPHVLKYHADIKGVPYHFIDLRSDKKPQINILTNASQSEVKEMFLAAFSLGEKGSEGDFYRLADRKAANITSKILLNGESNTFAELYNEVKEVPEIKPAAGFLGSLEEMAELASINALNIGVDLSDIVNKGGVVYVVGSMRDTSVMKAQRMLMIRLVQLCEKRDRLKQQRSVCVFLDELKYHLSKPAMEIFGAARDKGLHALVAHQSLSDLRDVPADLDADSVVGSVIENTAIKIIYKLQDPDTAEWIARRSGIKLVDEETRTVDKNIALSEIVDGERKIKQSETYLIDTNMLMNLPKNVAVFFSDELPSFICTSPVTTEKMKEAITPIFINKKIKIDDENPLDLDITFDE